MSPIDVRVLRLPPIELGRVIGVVRPSGAASSVAARSTLWSWVLAAGCCTRHLTADAPAVSAIPSAPWPHELPARALDFGSHHTALDVVVDQSHGLHEGVHGRRSDELPALLLQLFRQR